MKYAFKVTTTGRALLAELMAKEKPLEMTRAVFGSGTIDEASDLADQHELITPVAAGTVIDRKHAGDKLFLTAQYDNSAEENRDVGMFYLAEFIVYARHPESGEEVDLLYATLGDYKQPVPGYSQAEPPSVWKFPMVMVVSDKLNVTYSGAPGLVTYDDMQNLELELYTRLKTELSGSSGAAVLLKDITIPAAGWTWQEESDEQGEEDFDEYCYYVDVPVEGAAETQFPSVALHKAALETAKNAGLCPTVQTLAGALRFWAMDAPKADMAATVALVSPGSGGGNTGTTYVLPVATATRLGGVKIGDGISVAADGTITASNGGITPDDMATSADTEAMLDDVFPEEP